MPRRAPHVPGLGISEVRLCLDFVNTEGEVRNPPPERLANLEVFLAWAVDRGLCCLHEAGALGELAAREPATAERFLEQAREFRETLYRILAAVRRKEPPVPTDLDILNRELAKACADLELLWEEGEARLSLPRPFKSLEGLLGPIAGSAADLLRSAPFERIKECASATCCSMFIDESKNRSRRWCDMADCGNRAKARRFYRRHHKVGSSSTGS